MRVKHSNQTGLADARIAFGSLVRFVDHPGGYLQFCRSRKRHLRLVGIAAAALLPGMWLAEARVKPRQRAMRLGDPSRVLRPLAGGVPSPRLNLARALGGARTRRVVPCA